MNESMYFLLKMVIFRLVMLVNSGVFRCFIVVSPPLFFFPLSVFFFIWTSKRPHQPKMIFFGAARGEVGNRLFSNGGLPEPHSWLFWGVGKLPYP